MQGEDLKAARKMLGLNQDQLAQALGLSRVFVGMMERGEKAIELRTELAVRYLIEHPEAVTTRQPRP
jgi:DNA-binding XRE family transcriptional regulator